MLLQRKARVSYDRPYSMLATCPIDYLHAPCLTHEDIRSHMRDAVRLLGLYSACVLHLWRANRDIASKSRAFPSFTALAMPNSHSNVHKVDTYLMIVLHVDLRNKMIGSAASGRMKKKVCHS